MSDVPPSKSALEEALRSLLRENLIKHVSECKSSQRGNPTSFTEYETKKTILLRTYSQPPYALAEDRVEAINVEVEDALFVEQRKAVDSHLATLQSKTSTSDEVAIAYESLSHELFLPWFVQERYYCADYFDRRGGVRFAIAVLESRADEVEKVLALSLLWNFGSSERRCRRLVAEGVVPTLAPLLRTHDDDSRRIVGHCLGLLWGLIEFVDAQLQAIDVGFLDCFEVVLRNLSWDLEIMKTAAGCLHLCCANPSLAERIIDSGVVDVALHRCQNLPRTFSFFLMEAEIRLTQLRVQYLGYNAVASLCFRVDQKRWLDAVKGSHAKLDACVADFDVDKRMRPVAAWIDSTNPDEIREYEVDNSAWHFLHPFVSPLLAVHPVVRRLAAFSLSNLLQGPENRKLCVKEIGSSFGVVQCTAWGRDEKASVLARKAMSHAYPDGVDPPSLREMCLFSVSDNFDAFRLADVLRLPKLLTSKISPFCHAADL